MKNHPHDNIYSILGKLEALKPTTQEKHDATVKQIYESVEAQGSILKGLREVSSVETRLARQFAESDFSKMSAAIQKTGKSKASADAITAAAGREKLGQKEMTRRSVAGRKDEAYNPVKAVKQCAKDYMEMNGYTSVDQLEAEDIESIGGDCQMNYQDVCEILGCKLPDSLGPVKSYDEHGDMEECAGCAMGECAEHGMVEGETTYKNGVTTHRKTDFPGYPVDDNDDIEDTNKGKRGRPRKHAVKVAKTDAEGNKLGRGRPAKVKAPTYTKMADPFGRTTGAVPKSKVKGRVHTLDEAMAQVTANLANLTEGRHMVDESGETLQHILNRFRHEVRNFEQGGDLDKDLYDALYDYYCESGDMPYGIQKARTGDPMNWVADQLNVELGDRAYGADPANAEDYGIKDEAIDPTNPRDYEIPAVQRKAQGQAPLTRQDVIDKDQKAAMDYQRRVGNVQEDPLHHELNELARLAGLNTNEGNAFSGKLAHTAKGDNFEQDGKTFTNNSSIADKELDEEETDEGNEFSGELAKAKSQHKDSFKVGEKTYTVKEAQELVDMLKIAGLDTAILEEAIKQADKDDVCPTCDCEPCECDSEKVDEAKIEVDKPEEDPENTPDPKYASMKGSTMGPGEGDAGEKKMNPDRPTFKNGDNALAKPAVRESVIELESRLAAEYESIKKVS